MKSQIFPCCENKPDFLITYSVGGELKTYSVCKFCSQLECFANFIVKKINLENNGCDKN